MTLNITQGNTIANQENVSSALVAYLYNLANTNQLDNNSNLVGNLYVPGTYLAYIDKLTTDYTDLHITAGTLYVPFVDPEFGRIMMQYISSDGYGVTTSEIESVTAMTETDTAGTLSKLIADAFSGNTTVTSLKDLIKTNITQLRNIFIGCTNVTEIGIPSSVTFIVLNVLQNDSALKKVVVEDLDAYTKITYNSSPLFLSNSRSNVKLYKLQNGEEVEVTNLIVSYNPGSGSLFEKCASLQSVTFQEGVTAPGRALFADCTNLTSVTFPSTFTGILDYAFKGCTGLTSVDLSATNVTSTGQSIFLGCSSLTSVNLPSVITTIGNNTFYGCSNLSTISFPNSLTSIGNGAFYGCSNLSTVNFPDSLTSIGNNAFDGCPLPSFIDLSNTQITWATPKMFTNSNLTSIKFPTTLTQYGALNSANSITSSAITEIRGLDNVTTLYGFVLGNITHAINMSALEISHAALIRSTSDRTNISTSVLQLYMKSFKYSSNTKYENLWGRVASSMFCYRTNEYNALTQIGLMYFKDLEKVHNFQFYGARFKNLVINRTTPPVLDNTGITYNLVESIGNGTTWQSNLFGTIPTTGNDAMIIYVPDSAVATYLADSNYNSYTIRGINEVDPNTNAPYLAKYATNELWEAAGKPVDALIEEYM